MKKFFSFTIKVLAFQLLVCCIQNKNVLALVPAANKVVVVILENHSYNQVVGSSAAPYINSLINDSKGALFTQSYGLINASQPNYLQLFSGSNQGMLSNSLPPVLPFITPNLGAELIAASKTFIGYAESLPSVGYTGVSSPPYDRKHNPWVNWQVAPTNGIASALNQPFTSFPTNYNLLPSVSFVVPNELNNMHDGSDPARITNCDNWLQTNLDGYIQWAKSNNSVLILTFDEDDYKSQLHILTLFIGEKVQHGNYPNVINHYNILRTIEDMFSLPHAGAAATAATIDYCWKTCNQPALITASGPLTFCQGNSVTLTASTGVSYLWSNGATTQSIAATVQSNYTVAITDALICTATSAPAEVVVNSFSHPLPVFTETIGTITSDTPINTYETSNGFDNDPLTFSGNGVVSSTSPSSGYSGASGGGNLFISNVTGQNVVISNINTSGLSNLQLSFGIYKNNANTTSSDLIVQVSTDGISYTPLSYVTLPIGVALWNYRTATGTIPSTPNLRIQFLQTNSATQFRIDDITLKYAITAPSISASGSTSFCQGNTVALNATAASSYTWSNGPTTQNISVGTTGNYYVTETASNGCTATSNTISVNVGASVIPSVSISANTGVTICGGTNVTFTAVPTNGGATPVYQWKKNGTNVGTNSATYSDNTLATGNQITCVMTSTAPCPSPVNATSNMLTMTVNSSGTASVSISANPPGTICAGTNVTFTAVPVNQGTSPVYQWKKNGSNVGTNSTSYSDNGLATSNQITCVMTSNSTCATGSPATSNSITMIVNPNVAASVSISANPSGAVCSGTNVIFTAAPVNPGTTPVYQWKKNGVNVGTNSTTYSDNSLATSNQITCVFTSNATCATGSPATSNSITMTVNPNVATSVSISANPSGTVCAGTNVIFTATPVNPGTTPVYQWKKNGVNVGTNSASYSDNTLATSNQITCVMTSNATCATGSPATSNSITMTVNPNAAASVSISANPSGAVCSGTNVTFTAVPVNPGATPVYQWKKNGLNVGINSTTYSDNSPAPDYQVSCVMTSNATCVTGSPSTSNNISMIVNTAPAIANFSPLSGTAGSTVIINGVGFVNTPTVKFNGATSSIIVNSTTQISATVPAGASTGNITVSTTCGTATGATPFNFIAAPTVTLSLKLFIQGFYSGGGLMRNNANGGCLFINSISSNTSDVDTVFISAMNPTTYAEVNRQYGILKINGNVSVTFNASVITGNSYYIRVQHRSALETWSAAPVIMTASSSYDFTTSQNKAYGSNQIVTSDLAGWAFYSGDISHFLTGLGHKDGIIEAQDYGDMENAVYYTLSGYSLEDITGDGLVESEDYAIMENNVYATIQALHP